MFSGLELLCCRKLHFHQYISLENAPKNIVDEINLDWKSPSVVINLCNNDWWLCSLFLRGFRPKELLFIGALRGFRNVIKIAETNEIYDYCPMLTGASRGGNSEIALEAIKKGATNFDQMLANATRAGHAGLCQEAVRRGALNIAYPKRTGRR